MAMANNNPIPLQRAASESNMTFSVRGLHYMLQDEARRRRQAEAAVKKLRLNWSRDMEHAVITRLRSSEMAKRYNEDSRLKIKFCAMPSCQVALSEGGGVCAKCAQWICPMCATTHDGTGRFVWNSRDDLCGTVDVSQSIGCPLCEHGSGGGQLEWYNHAIPSPDSDRVDLCRDESARVGIDSEGRRHYRCQNVKHGCVVDGVINFKRDEDPLCTAKWIVPDELVRSVDAGKSKVDRNVAELNEHQAKCMFSPIGGGSTCLHKDIMSLEDDGGRLLGNRFKAMHTKLMDARANIQRMQCRLIDLREENGRLKSQNTALTRLADDVACQSDASDQDMFG